MVAAYIAAYSKQANHSAQLWLTIDATPSWMHLDVDCSLSGSRLTNGEQVSACAKFRGFAC